jgi:hypothetical protein
MWKIKAVCTQQYCQLHGTGVSLEPLITDAKATIKENQELKAKIAELEAQIKK